MANFVGAGGKCDIDRHFENMQIIFDTTFCGQWAGDEHVWGQGSCGQKAPSCEAFVKENPAVFKDAYWLVNSVKVFQNQGGKMQRRGWRLSVEEVQERVGLVGGVVDM